MTYLIQNMVNVADAPVLSLVTSAKPHQKLRIEDVDIINMDLSYAPHNYRKYLSKPKT